MRLETKFSISTGLVIAAMLSAVFMAYRSIREANVLYQSLTTQSIPLISLTRNLRYAMISVRALESSMLFSGDPAAVAQFRDERQTYLATSNAAAAQLLAPSRSLPAADAAQLRRFKDGIERLNRLEEEADRLNGLHTASSRTESYRILQKQILPLDQELFSALDAFLRSCESARDADMTRLNIANRGVLITLWAATILSALFGAVVSMCVARRISRRIHLLAQRADAIASGDLTGGPLNIHSSDQIGSLAQSMQQMQSSLARIIGTLAETAGSVSTSAVSMRSACDQVHHRVDEQTRQTHDTATAMQLMSASIAEVSRHTQTAAESARSAAQTAHEGGSIVHDVLESMRSIRSAFQDTSTSMALLGEDSRRISQIVTVISEIARKTNLLALNAAIEAARAGDQGRGFAVVAGEVRHLAESTAQATSEISAMIEGVQNRTGKAIGSMQAGNTTLEHGVATANRAGEALERIIGMAERVERMITQASIAAGQQSSAADQSSVALESILYLATDNLAELATTATGIECLQRTAAVLEQQVERFRLTAAPITPPEPALVALPTPSAPQFRPSLVTP